MNHLALKTGEILLPGSGIAPEKWAVVACDQFTSSPEYWAEAADAAQGQPSSLSVILPEVYLDRADEIIPQIHENMHAYLENGVLQSGVKDGFILVLRSTSTGLRPGLMALMDLDAYDYTPGSTSLIRATEGTVLERIPPRAKIRAGAPIELPHVLMLIDDPAHSVIEPLICQKDNLRKLYDFDLMLGGGHLEGFAVEGANAQNVKAALEKLHAGCGGLLYAVGDGNHSLAAAKRCWEEIRATLSEEEIENHPARWAMVELVNLCCDSLVFEPIHRLIWNTDMDAFIAAWENHLRENQLSVENGDDLVIFGCGKRFGYATSEHPLRLFQSWLDGYLKANPDAKIDYIHGEDELTRLTVQNDGIGIMPRAFDKAELFPFIRQWGVLPRKTFSMGHAQEKRYYMEARKILP